MKTTFMVIALTLLSTVASAKTLTYQADFNVMKYNNKGIDPTALDICGYQSEFKMNASAPIGPTFIKSYLSYGKISLDPIQATNGSVVPGAKDRTEAKTKEPYSGNYRNKVYVVKQVVPDDSTYKPFIAYRMQINTYGSTSAPSGFTVSTELLNHRYSAELAEGDGCGDIYYKLKN